MERSFTRNLVLGLAYLTEPRRETDSPVARGRRCRYTRSRSPDSDYVYFAYGGWNAPQHRARLPQALATVGEARRTSEAHGARFLLVYIPIKLRVLRPLCELEPGSNIAGWELTDLPDRVRDFAERQGIPYLDLTAALRAAASAGDLVYFPDDGHWNAHGNDVAAGAGAQVIRPWLVARPATPP